MMHPPSALPLKEYYALLAVARSPLHGYAIKAAVADISLGQVTLTSNHLYLLIGKLRTQGWLEEDSVYKSAHYRGNRLHYRLSALGRVRLEEEFSRLQHALSIMEANGFGQTRIDPEMQRLLIELESKVG